jgi:predicted transcriptional regulator
MEILKREKRGKGKEGNYSFFFSPFPFSEITKMRREATWQTFSL